MKHTYFTIEELCNSSVATEKKIDNTPNDEVKHNLDMLIDLVLDPLRRLWGKPIRVNSGYRCEKLNKAVGGASTSLHKTGCAADITTGSKADNKKLFKLIRDTNRFDLLIDEANYSWIHVSYKASGLRKQVLRMSNGKYFNI